jgi:hypothetical protein
MTFSFFLMIIVFYYNIFYYIKKYIVIIRTNSVRAVSFTMLCNLLFICFDMSEFLKIFSIVILSSKAIERNR